MSFNVLVPACSGKDHLPHGGAVFAESVRTLIGARMDGVSPQQRITFPESASVCLSFAEPVDTAAALTQVAL